MSGLQGWWQLALPRPRRSGGLDTAGRSAEVTLAVQWTFAVKVAKNEFAWRRAALGKAATQK